MKIGKHHLSNNIALAPMAGITDLPFRRLCRKLGAGYVVGEMLASDPGLRETTRSRQRGVHRDESIPQAIQIVGWDPQMMANAARYNADRGAAVIDINMGCPAKKVCKRYAGSALLADEAQVAKILEAVVASVSVPVTLKIRTGVSPQQINGVKIAKIAELAGICALAVHGRTRACKFKGVAEFDTVKSICQAVAIPVFANGDISNTETASRILNFTGADGLMIGRGAQGAPWFPGQLAQYFESGKIPASPSISIQSEIVLEHISEIYRFYGAFRGVRIARKHIKWYTKDLPDPERICAKMMRADSPVSQLRMVSDYYKQLCDGIEKAPAWRRKNKVKKPGKYGRKITNWQTV